MIFPLCLVLGLTKANPKLSVKRPPGDLISATSLLNLSAHMLLVFGCLLFIFLRCASAVCVILKAVANVQDGESAGLLRDG